jgi:hypothetical protein
MASENGRKEYREGQEAADEFKRTMDRVLTVSKEELAKREAAYKKARRAKRTRAAKAISR